MPPQQTLLALQDLEAHIRQLQRQLHEAQAHSSDSSAAQERCRALSHELHEERRAKADAENARIHSETALSAVHRELDTRTHALQSLQAELSDLKQTSVEHVR